METNEFSQVLVRSKQALLDIVEEIDDISVFKLFPLIDEITNFKIILICNNTVQIKYSNAIIDINGSFSKDCKSYAFILMILYTNLLNICVTNECYIQKDIQERIIHIIKRIGVYIKKNCFFNINDLDINILELSRFFKEVSFSIDMYIEEIYSEISNYKLETLKEISEAYSSFEVTAKHISFFDIVLNKKIILSLNTSNVLYAICSTYATAYCRTNTWKNKYSGSDFYCLFATPSIKIEEVKQIIKKFGLF